MIGRTLSHFKITAKLGEGGMGEVYRATDSKLGREVAIKVLPEAFTTDEDRLARFEREARVLASLSHTNIAGIFEVGDQQDSHFLVMELAEGETLAERIERGPIPQDNALEIALQIATGLEAAHDRGIVHRDLKPANVKITPEHEVKILDFGLARATEEGGDSKASSPDLTRSPTLAAHMTSAGVLMGTAAYMSPEQARGDTADRRSDIWAFGIVLLEMLSGKSVWATSSVSDTLAGVLAKEPPWEDLPADTPFLIRRLLERCLEKDPRSRLQAIGEGRIVLEGYLADPEAHLEPPAEQSPTAAATPLWRSMVPWAVAGAALVMAALGWWGAKDAGREIPVRRYSLDFNAEEAWRARTRPQLSPDGRQMLFAAENKLWVRRLDRFEPLALAGTEAARSGIWSPDSRSVLFRRGDKLFRTELTGGAPTPICDLPTDWVQIAAVWTADGRIVLARWRGGLWEVSAEGGRLTEVLAADETLVDYHDLVELPGGRGLLATAHLADTVGVVEHIQDWKRRPLSSLNMIRGIAHSPSGHLIIEPDGGGVWAVELDTENVEPTGEPFLVQAGAAGASVGLDGTMSLITNADDRPRQLVWIDRRGEVLEELAGVQQALWGPALSPDDRRLAYSRSHETNNQELWVLDLERSSETRLTFSEAENANTRPVWTPDGSEVVFTRFGADWSSEQLGIWTTSAEGGSAENRLVRGTEGSLTPDGGTLVYTTFDVRDDFNIGVVDLAAGSEPRVMMDNEFRLESPSISPRGRLLAYVSNETGEDEVYLTPLPSFDGRWKVSNQGGGRPFWSRDGSTLFFIRRNQLMEVAVADSSPPRLGVPQLVFTAEGTKIDLGNGLSPSLDGTRFVAVRELPQNSRLSIIQNWLAAVEGTGQRD